MARILYFEDNEKFRNLVKDSLLDYKHDVDPYRDPTDFLAKQVKKEASLSDYDILITDINMLSMNGVYFVKKFILDRNLKLPVIFMSGLDNIQLIKSSEIKDFIFLEKGSSGPEVLEEKIQELLKKI